MKWYNAVVAMLVVTPLWMILLFGILRTIDAETRMWVLYWCYVPASFGMGLLRAVAEGLD